MKKILTGLNEPQQQAVQITEGPLLVLAGPGSGKTRVLTHRVAYLILEKKISPYNLFVTTFTNKAADEMKQRIQKLLGYKAFLPWMGTFHSLCVRVLRQQAPEIGYKKSFTIYDKQDSIAAIKRVLKDLNIDSQKFNPSAIANAISSAKSELVTAREYQNYSQGYFQKVVAQVYPRYEENLRKAQAFDFDDLLLKTVLLFQSRPEILAQYQQIFRYILVDEYQDTNTVQYMLVKLLASKYKNICVVGDDGQSIYGFRGADFRNILNFEKDFPAAKVVKLEQNYRSTKNILQAAQKVIENNLHRSRKNLWTQNPQGAPIGLFEAEDEIAESTFVAREISALANLTPLSSFAVLYRTNAQSRALEEVFLQENLPYRIIGALEFYKRKEIKDVLAYLRLIVNPEDAVSLERILNVPPRGIGPKTIESFRKGEKNDKITDFLQMMENLRQYAQKTNPADLIDYILVKSGYSDFLTQPDKGPPGQKPLRAGGPFTPEEGESRLENIRELKTVAKNCPDLASFLEKVSLVSDQDNYKKDSQVVSLMTLHNAKGLEFPVVFIVGMEEGLFPHSRSILEAVELEEERRLCYVGMTRAKQRLYLLYALCRNYFGQVLANAPSRFLDEIPEDLIEKI
ncbi:MAG: ATP-dependent DNA helicase PcrA [Candidatus Nealsonbacteria bacterium CG10_big_fil_rev_8_21_14_0_10_40_24]|nr:MAG: ATP-dependent DNA helicase PcrA [Candidatus Nealsonbacteria bacterium CG10_big_fil_rev_8_21_14_0_10_40_24]